MAKSKASGSLYSEQQYPAGEGGGEEAQNLPENENDSTWMGLWLYEVEAGLEQKLARVDVPSSHYPFRESADETDRQAQPHRELLLPPRGKSVTRSPGCCCCCCCSTEAENYGTFLSPAGFRSGKRQPSIAPGMGRGVRKSS